MLRFFRGGRRRTAIIWWLIILGTAVGFIVGFSVFPSIVGTGEVSGQTTLGSVNGDPISQQDLLQSYTNLVQNYRAQTGRDPEGRDQSMLREQAWVQILTERALQQESKRLKLQASDAEVLFALRNTPPTWIRFQPDFQTNGQFDPRKYVSALNDPNYPWGPVEAEERRTLPAQKLEERILSTSKFSEPELRRAFLEQTEKARVTVARWAPFFGPIDTTSFTDATLRKYYDEHPGKFTGPDEANAVFVLLPKRTSKEDEKTAMDRARSVVERARRGESFVQLAREVSEAPNAEQGGEVPREVRATELPPEIGQKVATMGDSATFDPIREGTRLFVIQVRRGAAVPTQTYRIRQIMLTIPISEAAQQEDMGRLSKMRQQARSKGLGAAAAAMGIGAQETGWFNANTFVAQLYSIPGAQQWAILAPRGAISPIYDVETGFALLQVKERREEGVRPFDQVRRDVRSALERETRLKPALAAAERAQVRIRRGESFEQAAKAESAATVSGTDFFTRLNPSPLLSGSGRALGVAFGLPVGRVSAPISSTVGAILLRKDALEPASEAVYDSVKGNISKVLLSNRQQSGLGAWIDWLRSQSRIEDRRGDASVTQ